MIFLLSGKSEICKRGYSLDDVDNLLNNLCGQLSNHLLFLRSVSTIELYKCVDGERTPVLIRRAHREISNKKILKDHLLMNFFDRRQIAGTDVSNITLSRDRFYDLLASTRDEELPTFTHNAHIEVFGEQVGNLLESVEYFVVSGLRGGSAKLSACDYKRRHLKLVPVSQ